MIPIYRSHYQRTAGHPPVGTVPVQAGYNPDATPTPHIPGFGGDVRRVPLTLQGTVTGRFQFHNPAVSQVSKP